VVSKSVSEHYNGPDLVVYIMYTVHKVTVKPKAVRNGHQFIHVF
jgi:hypothetical protein